MALKNILLDYFSDPIDNEVIFETMGKEVVRIHKYYDIANTNRDKAVRISYVT